MSDENGDQPLDILNYLTRRKLLGTTGFLTAGLVPGSGAAGAEDDPVGTAYIGAIEGVAAYETEITITGTLDDSAAATDWMLELYELAPYEDATVHKTRDPVAEKQYNVGDDTFAFGIDRFENQRDRYHSKFLVVGKQVTDDLEVAHVDHPHYVTDIEFEPAHESTGPEPTSRKGLQTQLVADSEELGISYSTINISLDPLLFEEKSDPEETIVHEVDGDEFYFQRWYVKQLDRRIRRLTNNDVQVTAILLLYNLDVPEAPVDQLLHPDAAEDSGTVFAFNTTDENGVGYYKAALDFLMSRYSRDDLRYGRLHNYVIGNEVDAQWTWYNMGEKSLEQMVTDYEPAVRMAHQIARKYHTDTQVHISLTHSWTEAHQLEPSRYYPGRDVIDEMNRVSKRHGDFPWNIAHHPYPEDLFDPRWWEDESAEDSYESPIVNFKNLHILRDYMREEGLRYRGDQRRIDLTEQGFHTVDGTKEGERLQAAAYAYSYYKTHFLDGIDSFQYHRHVDHAHEFGLLLGLWTNDPSHPHPASPKDQKYSYDVFQKIDTEESLQVSEFAKDIIGIDTWEDVIPGFDSESVVQRSLPMVAGATPIKKTKDPIVIDHFDAGRGGWDAAEGVDTVTHTTDDAVVGEGALEVRFNHLAKLWRGAQVQFDAPIDVSDTPYLSVALKLPDVNLTEEYYAKVKAFDGQDAAEGIVAIEPTEGWHRVTLPLHGWDGIEAIDRLKIWARASRDNNDQWAGRLLLDAIEFSDDIVTEGGEANIDIATDASESLTAGDEITFTITNYDTEELTGELELEDDETDQISIDADSFHVGGLAHGESRSFTVTVTAFDPPEDGAVMVPFTYRDWTTQTVVWEHEPFQLLYDFEGGTVADWEAGSNVSSVDAVDNFTNGPQRPYSGSYCLEATSEQAPANAWRTITVSFDDPLDLTDAEEFVYRFNSYAFAPLDALVGEYETRLTLESGTETRTTVHQTEPNIWNEIRADIGDWSDRDTVTGLRVSFRQSTNPILWGGNFQIDHMGYVEKTD